MPIVCKSLTDFQTIWFNTTRPCDEVHNCRGIYFFVTLDKSNVKCSGKNFLVFGKAIDFEIYIFRSENDCRYPDQVRFIIKHEGLVCESNGNGATSLKYNILIIILTVIIYKYY